MPLEIEGDGADKPREKQADQLLRMCNGLELTHDADKTAFVTWRNEGARMTYKLRAGVFTSWLRWRAYKELSLTPNANAMQEALGVIEGRAIHDGKLTQVFRRVAEHDGKTYIDLCNDKWQAVEIDADDWRVVDDPPVRFIRGTGMLPLPVPERSGTFGALREFVNVADDAGFDLLSAVLIGAMQPKGPYPILALTGRQGSAKSTAARLLIALVDPNKAPLKSEPKSEDDLIVGAQHSRVVCFDNVSGLSAPLSDALCRLSTGGGLVKRKLYTDDDAVILDVQAPVILTGIGAYITKGDAADRALPVELRVLRDGDYIPERKLWTAFNEARPGILGALMDALSCSIRRREEVTGAVRMADFEIAVEAAGPALGWKSGHFNKLIAGVRSTARHDLLANDELAQIIIELSRTAEGWQGTMTALREECQKRSNAASWLPKHARGVSSAVKRLEPLLESVGVAVTYPAKRQVRFIFIPPIETPDAPDRHMPATCKASLADDWEDGYKATVQQPSGDASAPESPSACAKDGRARRAQENGGDTEDDVGDLVDRWVEE